MIDFFEGRLNFSKYSQVSRTMYMARGFNEPWGLGFLAHKSSQWRRQVVGINDRGLEMNDFGNVSRKKRAEEFLPFRFLVHDVRFG